MWCGHTKRHEYLMFKHDITSNNVSKKQIKNVRRTVGKKGFYLTFKLLKGKCERDTETLKVKM